MNQTPSRFHFDGHTFAEFELAMRLVFLDYKTARGFSESAKYGFVLYWHLDAGYRSSNDDPIPQKWLRGGPELDVDRCIDVVWRWLQQAAHYGEEPDIDGSCSRGFTIARDQGGHAGGSHYGFVSIKPLWAEHHK